MKKDKVLYLDRDDLLQRFRSESIDVLEFYMFKKSILKRWLRESLIIFIDSKFQCDYKILKSRYFDEKQVIIHCSNKNKTL